MDKPQSPAEDNETGKTKKNAVKKVASCIVYALLVAVLILLVFSVVANKSSGQPTFLFRHSILRVETGSMESTIPTKSYILVKKTDADSLKEGDIITFVSQDSSQPVYGKLVTHRIIAVNADGSFTTQGDANAVADKVSVQKEDVVAKYVTNLKLLTLIGNAFSSPLGLIVIIAVFLLSFSCIYLPDFIRAIKGKDEGVESESITEDEKEKIMQQRIEEEVRRLEEEAKKNEARNIQANDSDSISEKETQQTEKREDGEQVKK